jgi:hypothetical protein
MYKSSGKAVIRTVGLLLAVLLALGLANITLAAKPATNSPGKVTSLGYRANEKGNGALNLEWTGGNLGNTWAEGEWVAYQLVMEKIAPGLAGLDSIVISFDFTRYGGGGVADRFVDLVRGIQVGTVPRDDTQGWVAPGGGAFPVATREQVEIAQNHPLENVWSDFTLLNLPTSQINLTLDGGADTPDGEQRHIFKIYKSQLTAAGIDGDAPTVVIYYQLHESRTFIWENQLQAGYNAPPTDVWGGYLYGTDGWPTAAPVRGSGYVPGASGHIHLENLTGSQDVPIPIPETPRGLVTGLKWRDDDASGSLNGDEPVLSGWQIHVSGMIEGIVFTTSTATDSAGTYAFANLTSGTAWTIKEDAQRADPPETGYSQTYPTVGEVVGQGEGVNVGPPPPDVAGVGWEIELAYDNPNQDNMNFGNRLFQDDPPEIVCPCRIGFPCDYTGDYGVPDVYDDNDPDPELTYEEVLMPGECEHEFIIMRTWTATDNSGNSASCVHAIIVTDSQAPTLACAPDEVIPCGDPVEFTPPTAEDNCDMSPSLIIVSTEVSPGPGPGEFTHTRCWKSSDACGNISAQCCQSIIVEACLTAETPEAMGLGTATTQLPAEFAITGICPNPMAGSATIGYALPRDGKVAVEVFDMLGRKVTTLINQHKSAGHHGVVWNGTDDKGAEVAPGVYFCRAQFGDARAQMSKLIKVQ